jgi:hypothetical protein
MTVQDSPSDHARSITPSTISPLARTTEIGYSRWTSTARAGLNLLGVPEATVWVVGDWIARRRPPLREHAPYFIFILTINVFFCLVLPTQSLRNVKASHHVDLAYLYYLPFCSVFTSKDNFHAQIVPLFLGPMQTFMNGIDFKEDLKKLNAHYSALSEDVLKTGLINFAAFPPDDRDFLRDADVGHLLTAMARYKIYDPRENGTRRRESASSKKSGNCRSRQTSSPTKNGTSTRSPM